MKKYLSFIYLLYCTMALAQGQDPLRFRLRHDVPVSVQGRQLGNPWSGGLNTSQFSTIDLNRDGQEDLFIFDRQLRKAYTWLAVQQNGQWQYWYAPAYEVFFPAELENWVLLRDYNGLKDIFTSSLLGIKVYQQEAATSVQLKFSLAEEALYYKDNKVNLQMQGADVPAITDVDGDGDLDILISEFFRGFTLELYRNQQAEQNLDCGSLRFEQQTNCWDGITECDGCNSYLFGAFCRVAAPLHSGHDGSALLLLDMDADGDLGMLIGNAATAKGGNYSATLHFYQNTGTSATPAFELVTDNYLSLQQEQLFNLKPAFADINGDGATDLVLTYKTHDSNATHISYIPNKAGNGQPAAYNFADVQQLLSAPDNASPAFVDADADNDLDLLLGKSDGSLVFYRSTGKATTPVYAAESTALDSLGQDYTRGFLYPATADVDGDGAPDLLTTDESGTLRIYRNLPAILKGNAFTAKAELLENELLEGLQATRFGKGLSITAAPLGGEHALHLVIGTQGGGLYMLEQVSGSSGTPTAPEASLTLEVYPNPADRSALESVTVKASEPAALQVYDAIGRRVYRTDGAYSRHHIVPLQHLRAGMYIIRATSESGKHISTKFVVR